jgi:hypothetical protein
MSERSPAIASAFGRGRSAGVLATLVATTMTAVFGTATAASTPAPTPAQSDDATEPVAVEARECRRLTDFTVDDTGQWFVVNDGVMGGRSDGGESSIDDSVLRFAGNVVTAGGGFTSARLRLEGDELADSSRIEMRVRPDGRTYGVTLEDAAEFRGRLVSHRADFDVGPVDSDGWAIASVEYEQLVPSVFGILVDAPPFDPASAREFGIIIADGIDGDFALDIDWIDACP